MRFLVVDDDFEARRIVQKILHPYGFVDVATDGEECIASFKSALEDSEPYDIVFLDIVMPNMDGQQALRELREIEKEHGVPTDKAAKVIMISGLDNNEEVHDAFFLGQAESYIVKPIHKQVLLQELASCGISLESAVN